MKTPSYIVGIDGGQTGTRALLATPDLAVLGEGAGGPVRHLFEGDGAETRAAIHQAIDEALRTAGIEDRQIVSVACGLTGLRARSSEAARAESMIREVVRPHHLIVVPDFVTCLVGAASGGPGVVVAAGGGSVAYGRAADGREAQAGGWGYLIGDEGSGYDIGRRALTVATQAEDGRAPSTLLQDAIARHFKLGELAELKRVLYASSPPRERIAALAPAVASAARAGDEAAQAIVEDAGMALAASAVAVLRRLYPADEAVRVYHTGGVFGMGELILRPFCRELLRVWPRVSIEEPMYPPVMGALILAGRLLAAPYPVSGM